MILLYDRKLKQWERQNSPNFNHESPSFVQFYDHVYTVSHHYNTVCFNIDNVKINFSFDPIACKNIYRLIISSFISVGTYIPIFCDFMVYFSFSIKFLYSKQNQV